VIGLRCGRVSARKDVASECTPRSADGRLVGRACNHQPAGRLRNEEASESTSRAQGVRLRGSSGYDGQGWRAIFFRAVSVTRSRRMRARRGRQARGRRCSEQPGIRYASSRSQTLRRAIGLRLTTHPA